MGYALSHSPAKIVRHWLVDQGLGSLPSSGDPWPIFPNKEPNRPDNIVTVYSTTPVLNSRVHLNGFIVENLGFQIRVRASTSEESSVKIQNIAEAFDKLYKEATIFDEATYMFQAAHRESGPIPLGSGPDIDDVYFFTLNILLDIKQS